MFSAYPVTYFTRRAIHCDNKHQHSHGQYAYSTPSMHRSRSIKHIHRHSKYTLSDLITASYINRMPVLGYIGITPHSPTRLPPHPFHPIRHHYYRPHRIIILILLYIVSSSSSSSSSIFYTCSFLLFVITIVLVVLVTATSVILNPLPLFTHPLTVGYHCHRRRHRRHPFRVVIIIIIIDRFYIALFSALEQTHYARM